MTKYKALFRAVRHLTLADYDLSSRALRRADRYRAPHPYGKSRARRTANERICNGQMSGLARPHVDPTLLLPDPSAQSVTARAAGQGSQRSSKVAFAIVF